MQAGRYWVFTLTFWLIATLLMFFRALHVDHWLEVSLRFFYMPVLGLTITAAMTLVYQGETFRRMRRQLLAVVAMSAAASIITAGILNPVTYLLLGLEIRNRIFEQISTGALYYWLFYLLWSVLYFHLDGRPLLGEAKTDRHNPVARISVEDRGRVITISVADVDCFTANGDYVEIHVPDRSYLKKVTIASLEDLLDPALFRRVHRSTIVNLHRVARISARGSGAYELELASGRTVTASRSYRTVVKGLEAKS